MKYLFSLMPLLICCVALNLSAQHNFRIRTITAGVNITSLTDTSSIIEAIRFLNDARSKYIEAGYQVQTIRIATQNFHEYLDTVTYAGSIPYLRSFDRIAGKANIALSIGQVLPPNIYREDISEWAVDLITQTETINFSLPIAASEPGVLFNSIKASAEIVIAIANNSKGGEGNFRFTASANCPANIPFFPAAYHSGENSFAIGIEYPNVLTEVFKNSNWHNARQSLKQRLEKDFMPIEKLAVKISSESDWTYDGIDTSPAPGLDASIGQAIESLTGLPFGKSRTLSACALITDVIKNLELKTCGYSGLMLPVIEDNILARRAMENHYTVQELLLYSSVSGTGLDVVPIPGNTTIQTIESLYTDVASLSLKYGNKALSARLFLIPDKTVGDMAKFENPYLTSSIVMKVE